MAEKTIEFEFRGETFEISLVAARSMKVQKAIAYSAEAGHEREGYWAIDMLCCGRLDEYIDRLPEEDGEVAELGASTETFQAFMRAAAEAAKAKN